MVKDLIALGANVHVTMKVKLKNQKKKTFLLKELKFILETAHFVLQKYFRSTRYN